MNKFFYLIVLLSIAFSPIQAQQKRALEHEDFAIWNQINRQLISNDGNWVSYVVQPGEGNPTLYLYNGTNGESLSYERADQCKFSQDNKFIFFTIFNRSKVKAFRMLYSELYVKF